MTPRQRAMSMSNKIERIERRRCESKINDRLPLIFRTAAISVERAPRILAGIGWGEGLFASPILILSCISLLQTTRQYLSRLMTNSLMNGASVEGCFESTLSQVNSCVPCSRVREQHG